ncbi:HAMP domain-containing sensor histidine kinase [Alteromonas oceanisediminis]|uniref:HAMP domain-containing sensor histidine kinase n=1 Tax=Alteromonas oceanisediminis TaxID=2836180 RepID=UPI001BDB50BD|nr:ATP-binding protein [Alteromonas oceanisediminis]MBT0586137.1 two-component sensor histidine kinase [Alteromonas oceanisediminis]
MRKIYLGIIITVVGSLIFIGAILDLLDSESNQQQAPNELSFSQQMLLGIATQLSQIEPEDLIDQTAERARQFDLNLHIVPLSSVSLPASLLSILQEKNALVLESDNRMFVFNTLQNHPGMLLQLTVPARQEESYFTDMMMTLGLYAGLILMLFLWLLPLTSRLRKLTELAAEFGNGDLGKRIQLSRFSYIEGLEQSFNRMAAKIETLIADNKILAGSLSHDLRTPLACLRFGVEAAIETQNREKQSIYLQRVDSELTRLENMLEAFLEYASLEQSGVNLVKQWIDVKALTLSVVDELQPLAKDSAIEFSFALSAYDDTKIRVDAHWVYRAILNVLGNAIEHANNCITVELYTSGNTVTLAIHDDGDGIEGFQSELLFAPFQKGDQSRNRDQQHYGLGLAIVSKVVEWHNGLVSASNSTKLRGACFAIQLPID